MLSINRIDDDASALSDIFILYFNRGTVLLALYGSGAIIQIHSCERYMVGVRHCLSSLEMDLLANFVLSSLLQVASFKRRGLSRTGHLCQRLVRRRRRSIAFLSNR
jgi:hypothetical protein